MKHVFLTIGLFAFTQLLLRIVSGDDIATAGELISITLFIGLFMGIYFAGYRWARWVAVVFIGIFAMVIGSLVFEGFGIGYLAMALLYVAVIFMLFMKQPKTNTKRVIIPDPTVIDMINTSDPLVSQKPPVKDGFYAGEEMYKYPLLVKRYQSVFIDSLILFTIMVVTMVVLSESEARQPVMISLWGYFFIGPMSPYSQHIPQLLDSV